MKYLFGVVYILVLATQLPHVWYAYASLEAVDMPLAHVTAIGAAIAFELSTGVFTFRVVSGSKRRWPRIGLAFFIAGSAVANAYYYRWLPLVFDTVMPIFATLALPAALALFAEEFGAEVKREQSAAKRAERQTVKTATAPMALPWACPDCDRSFASQQALAGHIKFHRNGHERVPEVAGLAIRNDGPKD